MYFIVKTKWYQKNWFVILMLIFIFPLGLFLMWYFKKWNNTIRWVVTAVVILFVLISPFVDTKDNANNEAKKENTTTKNTTKEDKNDKKDDEVAKKEIKETSEKAEKTKKPLPKEDKTMSVEEYQGVVRSYQSQIQLAGDDLMKLENEINDNGKTTNKGKDLLYAISGTLESSSLILDGAKNDVIPPSEFKQEHKNLKEADNYFQTAAKQINNFEETENPEELNNALEQIQTGVDNADISIRNILEN